MADGLEPLAEGGFTLIFGQVLNSLPNPPLNLPPSRWGETLPSPDSESTWFETSRSRLTGARTKDVAGFLPLSIAMGTGTGGGVSQA